MADGYNNEEDEDAKETKILPAIDRPPRDLEGTVEMDRKSLMHKLESDSRSVKEPAIPRPPEDADEYVEDATESVPDTMRLAAVEPDTTPSKTAQVAAVPGKTQHYDVPESVMNQMRHDADMNTMDVALELLEDVSKSAKDWPSQEKHRPEELGEFRAIIDQKGRIVVPERLLQGRFPRGVKVHVVVRVVDE